MGAKRFVNYALKKLAEPDNKRELTTLARSLREECKDDMDFQLRAMIAFPPVVWSIVGSEMAKYGFHEANMTVGVLQINAFAEKDPHFRRKLDKIIHAKAITGGVEGKP